MNGVNYGDRNMEMILIEDCCEILDSKRIPITAKNRTPGPYPYYGANGIQDYVDNYIFDDELVLLAEDGGNFGSTEKPIAYRVSGKCWVNNHAHVLKPRNGIDVDYLCYSLMFYDTNGLVNGATRQKLTQSTLKKMSIPKRTVKQQLQIVQELNTIKKMITARQQELQKLDDLIKARFVEMFGDPIENPKNWKITTVGDIVTEVRYGTSKPAVEGGQYPYLRMNNLTADGHLDLHDLKYIDISDEEIEKCVVRTGDVLFNRTNSIDLVGKTALFDLPEEMVIAGYIIRIRLKKNMLPEVFSEYMNLKALKDILRSMAKGAVNQANINAQELQSIKIYLPDIELQKQFVTIRTQIDKSKATVQKALDETQLLFDSLMQQYFG